MKAILLLVCLMIASKNIYSQAKQNNEANAEQISFKDPALADAYARYILLKDLLVSSNQTEAKKAAEMLKDALDKVAEGKKAAGEAEKIAAASKLKHQREYFASLSIEMIKLVKGALSNGKIYVQHCHMAFGGSYWLSNQSAVLNPYFGKAMLTCGSVEETIE